MNQKEEAEKTQRMYKANGKRRGKRHKQTKFTLYIHCKQSVLENQQLRVIRSVFRFPYTHFLRSKSIQIHLTSAQQSYKYIYIYRH